MFYEWVIRFKFRDMEAVILKAEVAYMAQRAQVD